MPLGFHVARLCSAWWRDYKKKWSDILLVFGFFSSLGHTRASRTPISCLNLEETLRSNSCTRRSVRARPGQVSVVDFDLLHHFRHHLYLLRLGVNRMGKEKSSLSLSPVTEVKTTNSKWDQDPIQFNPINPSYAQFNQLFPVDRSKHDCQHVWAGWGCFMVCLPWCMRQSKNRAEAAAKAHERNSMNSMTADGV